MELGHLNIQKPDLTRVEYVQDVYSRLHVVYSNFIEGPYSSILAELSKDKRFETLRDKMVSNGSGGSRFDLKTFAMWFLWAINEYGEKQAREIMDEFLDSDKVKVLNTLWVLGIECDEIIDLKNGIKIIPLDSMPDSKDKTRFKKIDFDTFHFRATKPKAALVAECEIDKVFNTEREPGQEVETEHRDISTRLYNLSHLLNILEGVSCRSYYSTTYTYPGWPMGHFGGSSGGSPVYDIHGFGSTKISSEQVDEINLLLEKFAGLSDKDKSKFLRILSRVSQAKRRQQVEDQILDIGIALEMALLDDNNNHNQLSLTFRLRGSWLVSQDKEDRHRNYKILRDLYNFRSEVAHTGVLCKNDFAKINEVRGRMNEFFSITSKILRTLIENGNPDWTKLILDLE